MKRLNHLEQRNFDTHAEGPYSRRIEELHGFIGGQWDSFRTPPYSFFAGSDEEMIETIAVTLGADNSFVEDLGDQRLEIGDLRVLREKLIHVVKYVLDVLGK